MRSIKEVKQKIATQITDFCEEKQHETQYGIEHMAYENVIQFINELIENE